MTQNNIDTPFILYKASLKWLPPPLSAPAASLPTPGSCCPLKKLSAFPSRLRVPVPAVLLPQVMSLSFQFTSSERPRPQPLQPQPPPVTLLYVPSSFRGCLYLYLSLTPPSTNTHQHMHSKFHKGQQFAHPLGLQLCREHGKCPETRELMDVGKCGYTAFLLYHALLCPPPPAPLCSASTTLPGKK